MFFQIRNPRGLLDSAVTSLVSSLRERSREFSGEPVIFELIELAREFLTEQNVPACNCAICLNDIVGEDVFVKTLCYHYFHAFCLGRYVDNAKKYIHQAHFPD